MQVIMEQDEITRRNVAIAEYMFYPYPITPEFNSNWHSLMPVVEKIADARREAFHCGLSYKGGWFARFGMDKNSIGKSMIEATWIAVSEYVLSLKP